MTNGFDWVFNVFGEVLNEKMFLDRLLKFVFFGL